MTHAYRPDIEGLRALAVLAVIANHVDAAVLPGGYLGVDVFFVISGFVITRSIERHRTDRLGPLLLDFFARRARRILPALLVCVGLTAPLLAGFDPDPKTTLRTAAAALLGVANLYLFRTSSDYFAASAQLNGFTHTWSLGVEEQFYLGYPLLAGVLLATSHRQGGSAWPARLRTAVGLLALVSLAGFVWWVPLDRTAAFYLSPFRFWELGFGCVLALTPAARRSAAMLAPAALAMLAACLATSATFSAPGALAAVAATGGLLYAGGRGGFTDRLLTFPPCRYIGRISYSLYLWHWPVLTLARRTIGLNPATTLPMLVLIFALAAASARWVERPWQRPRRDQGARRAILTGLTASAATAAGLFALSAASPGTLFLGRQAPLQQRGVASLIEPVGSWQGAACVLQGNAERNKRLDPDRCTIGNPASARRRLLVIGNSYAASLVRGVARLASDDGYAVTVLASWGASPSPSLENRGPYDQANAAFWGRIYPAAVAALRPGDVVLLASDLAGLTPRQPSAADAALPARFASDVARMSATLARRGITLAVLDALPYVRDAECQPDVAIAQWYAPFGPPCRFEGRMAHLARRAPVHDRLAALDAAGAIVLVDLFEVFCPGPRCTYATPRIPILYRDEYSHPSAEAMPAVHAALRRRLAGAGQEPAKRAGGG